MTGNIIVFPEALKNAAAEIGKRSAEWNEEAEKMMLGARVEQLNKKDFASSRINV